MRLAISSASTPALTPPELIEAARLTGYAGIEWRVADVSGLDRNSPTHFRTNNLCTVPPEATALRAISAQCRDAGLHVLALSPYLEVGALSPAEDLIAVAAEIGVGRIRVWAPPSTRNGRLLQAQDTLRRWLADLTPALLRHRVQLVLEIHQATVCPSAAMAMRVVADLDPAAIGVLYDVGNLAVEGYEHPPLALELIGTRLSHVQIKNARWTPGLPAQGWQWSWCPMDEGLLCLPQIVADLHAAGFDGWLSAEDFSTQFDDRTRLQHNHRLLIAWIQAALQTQPFPLNPSP